MCTIYSNSSQEVPLIAKEPNNQVLAFGITRSSEFLKGAWTHEVGSEPFRSPPWDPVGIGFRV